MSRKTFHKPRWTKEAIAKTWDVIYYQDTLLTALGIGLQEIHNQDYDAFRKVFLNVITRTISQLEAATNDVLDLRQGQGRPATWFLLAEEAEALTAKARQGVELIRTRDIRRNDWAVAVARLEACRVQVQDIQRRIIRALPKESHPDETYVSQRSILWVYEMAKTLYSGDSTETPTGGRWRNT